MKRRFATFAVAASLAATSSAAALAPALAAPAANAQAPDTLLTIQVAGCEGCTFTAITARGDDTPWQSGSQVVAGGQVSISVPSDYTTGLTLAVGAPWEGATGYATYVAFRYNGQGIGDPVGFKQARSKKRAAGCWAGTVNDAVTIKVKVRRVKVAGAAGPAAGMIAWTPSTQPYLKPMQRVNRGVLGSQAVLTCEV